jgi:NTE family protein
VEVGTPSRRSLSRTAVLAVASSGALLAFLDATIVNIAFPDIRASFPASSISSLSWVLNAYNIVFAAFLLVSGRLADLFGRRRMFIFGVVLFTMGSAACGAAPSLGLLVAARVVQAFGAAVLVPASLALVVQAFPAERRAHAVGLWGASAAAAAGLGPPLGGALIRADDWRLVFLINVPLGVATIALARRVLVESRAPGHRLLPDMRGAVFQAASFGLLTLAIVQGDRWGWASAVVMAVLAGAVVTGALAIQSSRRHRAPILDPVLLRIRSFSVASIASGVSGIGFYAYLLNNVLWLHYVWSWSLLQAGAALAPAAVVAAIAAGPLGRLADARGHRFVAVPGALVWAGAYAWYATRVGMHPDFLGEWLPGQVLSGLGVAATLPILGSGALAAVPGGRFATASAAVSSVRQLGGVLGVALLIVIVGTPTSATIADRLRHGWIFSAFCFVAVAGVALFLRREASGVVEHDDADLVPVVETAEVELSSAPEDLPALLDELPARTREHILAAGRALTLRAGDVLVRAGDPADALYVLEAGRLEVLNGSTVAREIAPGEVVGELGVLARTPRSATIRARRDSSLLRIDSQVFVSALEDDAAAQSGLTAVLARRLQQTVRPDTASSTAPTIVAVLGVGPSPAVQVAALLAEELRRDATVAAPRTVSIDELDRLERDFDYVLLAATGEDDGEWRDFCIRQADRLVLVADAATEPHTAPESASYVLLVGNPAREALLEWWQPSSVRRVFLATDAAVPAATSRIAARIAGRSLGVTFAGGGARAFASIGVLFELEAAGIDVDRVSGASLGSIIAALHARGLDSASIDAACYDEFVRRNPFGDYTLPKVAVSRGRRAEAALERHFGDLTFEELQREAVLVSTDLLARAPAFHRRGIVREAIRASLSLPALFPPARINESLYIDGSVLDNLPVTALADDEGPVLAVNISAGGALGRRGGAPRTPTLPETLLRAMLMGSARAVEDARRHATIVVTPDTRGIGLLEFHQLDRAIEAGRRAGRSAIEALLATDWSP